MEGMPRQTRAQRTSAWFPARVDCRSVRGQFPHYDVRHGEIQAMKDYDFKVLLEPDETGGYVATCPSLPGCYSQGDTVDGAAEQHP